jgi:hypothetical protein
LLKGCLKVIKICHRVLLFRVRLCYTPPTRVEFVMRDPQRQQILGLFGLLVQLPVFLNWPDDSVLCADE